MIQNLIFGILFLKILFRHTAFLYSSTRFSGHHDFFLIFRFSSRKPQSQQKLEKNDTQFTIQFRSKNLTHFYKSQLIWHWNDMIRQATQSKTFLTLHNFQQTRLCFMSEKTFLDGQELHSWSTWEENVCVSLYISVRKLLFQRRSKIAPRKMFYNFSF